ncbi:hypothetical protein NGA84_01555 [Lactococcus formosensis]|uniref:Uncharacterized protein n=1 Tax=Lactococcus formosensis TaxID=1281486 RepID=A0A9X4PBD3_9LACT|nr:hypothetical protein [Lactococcus formosensis]MDG6142033.1 hypothetical protein [Lactococcus formosensis]MDG6159237.1 hypothetical protein [Lactococcus formosensis]MDG6165472.1 hypothetical protein [Lactococcus formosensis]MDG6171925.1 hypothetical protein [Lactococcus formosensis]MDG6192691.1 hypothetical protein [Lactococcus formosensis]
MTTVHKPKTEIGKKKFEIAEALNTITDLQNAHKNKELTAEQRYQLFNTSMRTVCDLLDIDLDMHELLKTGSEGFSYSDTEEDTKELEKFLNSPKQPQETLKSIIQNIKDVSTRPSEYAGEDMDVLGDLVYSYVSDLCNALGFEDMSDSKAPTNEYGEKQQSVKDILLALHEDLTNEDLNSISLRDFGRIHVYDLADLLGIEQLSSIRDIHIVEGEQWLKETAEKLADQETYDNLPAEDKLNVDMLDKLHELQDHVLNSGQTAVSMNQVQTAISLLECSLGVMGKVEE